MKKWHALTVVLLLIVLCHWCSGAISEDRQVAVRRYQMQTRKLSFREMLVRRIKDLWSWVVQKTTGGDTFVGRCLGVARKLKMIMPLLVFKMGVIITVLIFLTIFSLKSLGLLITLLFVNTGGLFSKLAGKEHESSHQTSPQNVHYHVHPDKYGYRHHGHSSYPAVYSHDPWDRSIYANTKDLYASSKEDLYLNLQKRLDLIDLYHRLGLTYGDRSVYASHKDLYSNTKDLYGNTKDDLNLNIQKRLDLMDLYHRLGLTYGESDYDSNNYVT